MIPMGGIDDVFVGECGVGAGDDCGDVMGFDFADGSVEIESERGCEGGWGEAAGVGSPEQVVDGEAGGAGRVAMYPGGEAEGWRGRVALELDVFATPGILNDIPAVAGGFIGVDEECAEGTLARGFFELVGPATVVGECLAIEEGGVVAGRLSGEQDNHLALDVDASVIIPLEFWGTNAVTYENERGSAGDGGLLRVG